MKDLDSFDARADRSAPRALDRSSDASADSGTPVILTVCTGNICRSPLAEALLRARLHGVDATVHSAGTHAPVGAEMTGMSQEIAVAHGASPDDVVTHRARWVTEPIVAGADLVLAMSREHRTASVELAPSALRRAFTVREFAALSTALDDDAIRRTADAAGTAPRARLAAVLALVAGRRGQMPPARTQDDDVIDPYRRDRAVYEESASQLIPAVDEVARVLRAALL
ncbi:low molecular weight phosphatase family protein [Microbacterium natoriense]|uniref:arsenate reductase/protein-tyrosine-phosphatase family protein n=1 Tax=Microbacterium natoriense TaxID=284570 RepID=UPI0031CFCDF3